MTTFTFSTGDVTFDGTQSDDRFSIFGPDDTDEIYTVTANGGGGNDDLIHSDLDQINIIYNAGDGADTAEIRFGNVNSTYVFDLGSGDDLVVVGDETITGLGSYTLTLGEGQDQVVIFDSGASITIEDFEAGSLGDQILLADLVPLSFLSDGTNPFSTGQITIANVGADTHISIFSDGNSFTPIQVIVLENTDSSLLTSFNFGGYSLTDNTITESTLTSESSFDTFFGTNGNDTITASGTFTPVFGLSGNDVINGSSGRDDFFGGAGDDILNGGGGNDTLNYVGGGNDVLNGGSGNDLFRISNSFIANPEAGRFSIVLNGDDGDDRYIHIDRAENDIEFNGGLGNDTVDINSSSRNTNFDLNLGSGNDVINIGRTDFGGGEGNYTINLGAGLDAVNINSVGISPFNVTVPLPVQITIEDFEAGDNGDQINLNFSDSILNWNGIENPFETGAARILQIGDDVIIQFEQFSQSFGGTTSTVIAWADVVTLENITLTDLTAHNFTGIVPPPFISLGSEEADVITGTFGDDIIQGLGDDDTLNGSDGNDTLIGGEGNDILAGGLGVDNIDGGGGIDTNSFADIGAAVTASIVDGTVRFGSNFSSDNEAFINIENLTETESNDSPISDDPLFDFPDFDTLFGGASDDIVTESPITETFINIENLTGTALNDSLTGDNGNNVLNGGEGNDVLFGSEGNDTLIGGDGNDLLTGGLGVDNLDGGAGVDTNSFTDIGLAVTVSIVDGTASYGSVIETFVNIQNLIGTELNDNLTGDNGNNLLIGATGNDVLLGLAGDDTLSGGAGNDILTGGTGVDIIDGGAGIDTNDFSDINAEISANISTGTASYGNISEVFTNIENLTGASLADSLTGDAEDNILNGLAGNDTLTGGAGNDTLIGGIGTDIIDGGAGIDTNDFSDINGAITANIATGTASYGNINESFVNIENLTGANLADRLTGDAGDNILNGLAGNDILNGNIGNDLLIGSLGDDTLIGDGTPSLSLESVEGEVYRAFQAVFDRAPDLGGFNAFVTEVRAGRLTQEDVITEFVESPEFQQTFGSLDNRGFVEQLFRNVLDREGDAQGVTNFTNALNSENLTRAEVVLEFANSPEFLQLLTVPSASFATNVIIHPAEGQVFRIFQAVFNREPDAGGFTNFVNSIQAGVLTAEEITAEFVESPEFQATFGDLDDTAFIELLFTNVLPGNTDPIGRAAFIEALGNCTLTRAAVVAELADSQELRNSTADAADAFVATVYTTNEDTLEGGEGNDVLFGGRGVDEFVFNTETDGNDTILDYTIGVDRIDFGENTGFDSVEEVLAVGTQVALNTVFDFGNGNTLTLENTVLTDLTVDDFGFGEDALAVMDDLVDVLI